MRIRRSSLITLLLGVATLATILAFIMLERRWRPAQTWTRLQDTAVLELPDALHQCLRRPEISPKDAFECFFAWYNDAWLIKADLWAALDEIPRPLREVMVTHQAWGYMSSEAPNGYYGRFDQRFDDEIRKGLSVLGRSECFTALAQGRQLYSTRGLEGLTLEEDRRIYDQLPSLEEMEGLIGEYLLAVEAKAK